MVSKHSTDEFVCRKYEFVKQLGTGSFGKVDLIRDRTRVLYRHSSSAPCDYQCEHVPMWGAVAFACPACNMAWHAGSS